MKTKTIHVTPQLATDWLKRNTRNRPVNRGHVERIKRDILAGRWIPTHQGIAFGTDGRLLDGQHRLTAIAECGTAVPLTVSEDVPLDAALVMDGGETRRLGHRARIIDGEQPSALEVATINAMAKGLSQVSKDKGTSQEQIESYRAHISAARFACSLVKGHKKGLGRASAIAVIARASYTIDHGVLRRFCSILMSGVVEKPSDAVVILLRDFLMSSSNAAGGAANSSETYRKTARALDAFRKGERLGKLYETRADPFPLPDTEDVISLRAVG